MESHRFRKPWSVVSIPGGYRVVDATGRPLGYFYSYDDPSARRLSDVLTPDEARFMAENFARMPEFLSQS
jgi:hypothetical protein